MLAGFARLLALFVGWLCTEIGFVIAWWLALPACRLEPSTMPLHACWLCPLGRHACWLALRGSRLCYYTQAGFARLLALAVGSAITSWLSLRACWPCLLAGFERTAAPSLDVAGFARLLALAVGFATGFAITCWLALPARWPCRLAAFAQKLAGFAQKLASSLHCGWLCPLAGFSRWLCHEMLAGFASLLVLLAGWLCAGAGFVITWWLALPACRL